MLFFLCSEKHKFRIMYLIVSELATFLEIFEKSKYIRATTKLQRICYSHWGNGARNGVISIRQWGVFNHEKGAILQSHLAAQKERVVATNTFSNNKIY